MNPLINSMLSNNRAANGLKNAMQIKQAVQAIKSGNASALAFNMMNSNPQFRTFYEANKNRPVEQVAQEYGIDMAVIRDLLR